MGKYTVKSGDGWWRISQQTGVSEADLKKLNPEIAQKGLDPGDKIKTSSGLFSGISDLFTRDNSEQSQSTPETLKTGAYYVNFPNYDVSINRNGDRAKLGHAGVLVVNKDGSRKLYEYGRYDNGNVGVQLGRDENGDNRGNWRVRNISGTTLDDVSKNILAAQSSHAGNNVRLTHVNADPQKVINYINNDANNPNRDSYSVCGYNDKNCGSMASEAIEAGTPWYTNALHGTIGALRQISRGSIPYIINSTSKLISKDSNTGVRTGAILGLISGKSTPQDYEDQYLFNDTHTYSRNK